MKRLRTTVVLLLSLALILSGCSLFVPDEYKDGVKIDRDYPDDELPVYEDAIVFSSDKDKSGEITLLMGTKDDLDDIVDFYKDHFEDEDILLTNERERKTSYTAEGHVEGYDFKLKAQAASGKWEEKLFSHVIEIVVTPAEEPVIAADDFSKMILGTWTMTGVMLEGRDVTSEAWEILICTYNEDGTGQEVYKWPYQPEYIEAFTWQITDGLLVVSYEDGSDFTTAIGELTDTTFTELSSDHTETFDTIIYERVPNAAWRPEYTTPPYDDTYYGDPADIEDIYGAWVDYALESSFSLWTDGSGRIWNTQYYPDGLDITWDYSDDGTLTLYNSSNQAIYSYFVTFDGIDIFIESEELGIYQYMQRPSYAITDIPWVMVYDNSDPEYAYDARVYVYFFDDNTYEVNDYSIVTEFGTWEYNEYGDLELYNDTGYYYYYVSYEGSYLLFYTIDNNYYWYQSQYDLQ